MEPITCPSCGRQGQSPDLPARAFRYLEDVTSLRWVEGVDASGALRVEAGEQIDVEEGGRSPRLQCAECLVEFPLPRGTEVKFVC
jgi:hypothetical protein